MRPFIEELFGFVPTMIRSHFPFVRKMNFRTFALLIVLLSIASCAKPYKPPGPNEPHAILKVRRVYETSAGETLSEGVGISGHNALSHSIPSSSAASPQTDAILIHPVPEKVALASTFFHMEMRTVMEHYTVQVPYSATESYSCGSGTSPRTCMRSVTHYRSEQKSRWVTKPVQVVDSSCSRELAIAPTTDGVYLVQFTYHEHGACSLSCFEQKKGSGDEVENAPCPTPSYQQLREIEER